MQVGITFDHCNVTSADDAHYHKTFLNGVDGITKGCEVSYSGRAITISKGYFIISGRFVKIVGDETVTVDENIVSGGVLYGRLVYEIDLSKTNTVSEFNQGAFKVLTNSSSAAGYPSVRQDDLDNGGTVYQMPFAKLTINSTGISQLVAEISRIDFNSLYTELRKVQSEYSSVIDEYVEELKNQGFITQAAYHADNTPEIINIAISDWVYASVGKWYYAVKECTKASASSYCLLHIKAIADNTKEAKRAADKAFSYIYSDPIVEDGRIIFRAWAKPEVALKLSVVGGIGQ